MQAFIARLRGKLACAFRSGWEFERFCFGEHIEVKPRYAIIDDLRSNVNLRNMGARPDGDGPSGKTEVPFRTRVNKYGIYGHGGF